MCWYARETTYFLVGLFFGGDCNTAYLGRLLNLHGKDLVADDLMWFVNRIRMVAGKNIMHGCAAPGENVVWTGFIQNVCINLRFVCVAEDKYGVRLERMWVGEVARDSYAKIMLRQEECEAALLCMRFWLWLCLSMNMRGKKITRRAITWLRCTHTHNTNKLWWFASHGNGSANIILIAISVVIMMFRWPVQAALVRLLLLLLAASTYIHTVQRSADDRKI